MAISEDLVIRLAVDSQGAVVGIKDLTGGFTKLSEASASAEATVSHASKGLVDMALEITGLNQALELAKKAFELFEKPVESMIEHFIEADKATRQLANALASQGEFTKESLDNFKEFAEELSKTSTASKDTIINLLAMGKATGLTDVQLKSLIKASQGLAAVTGQDLNGAYEQLIGQFAGIRGRIAKFVPELQGLNDAQLKAGQGIELIARKYGSFAGAEAKSLEGALKQQKNAFGEVLIESGKLISQLVDLPGRAAKARDFYLELAEKIKGLSGDVQNLRDAIGEIQWDEIAVSVRNLAIAVGILGVAIAAVKISSFVAALGGIATIADVVPAIQLFVQTLSSGALLKSLGAIAASTAEFVAIGVAVVAVAGAVDILFRNLGNLGDLVTLIGNAFFDFFARVNRGFIGLATGVLLAFQTMLEPLAKVSDTAEFALGKIRGGLGSLVTVFDDANKKVEFFDKGVESAAKGIDFGVIGQGVNFFKNLLKDSNDELKEATDNTQNITDKFVPLVAASQAYLSALKSINAENMSLAQNIASEGQDEITRLKVAMAFDLARVELKKEELAEQLKKSELTKTEFDALTQQLVVQAALIKQLSGLKIEALQPTTFATIAESLTNAFEAGKEVVDGIQAGGIQSLIPDKETLSNMGSNIASGFANADLSKVATEIAGGLKDAAGFIMDAFNPENINKLADTFGNLLANLPDLLIKAFDGLDRALDKFIAKFPAAFQRLVEALPGIVGKLLDRLPALIDVILNGLVQLLDKLPEIFDKLFAKLPEIIDQILKKLPTIIKSLFAAIGSLIADIIKAIPGVLKSIFDNLPDIIQSIIEGILGAMGDIVTAFVDFLIGGGLEKIVGAFLRMIPKLIVAIVNGIINGLVNAVGKIFGGIKMPASVTDIPQKFTDGMKNLAKKATEEASQLFKVLDLAGAARGLGQSKEIGDAIDAATKRLGSQFSGLIAAWRALWDFIMKGLNFLWGVLKAVWDFVVSALTALWSALKQIWDLVVQLLTALWAALKAVWDGVITALSAVWDALKKVWDGVITALTAVWDALKKVWDGVITALSAVWEVYRAGWQAVTDTLATLWNTIKGIFDVVITGMSTLWDGVKKIWDGITTAFSGVVNIFKGIFDNMKAVFTDAFDGIKKFFTDLFKGNITAAFKDVLDTFSKVGGKIWDGLKDALTAGAKVITGLGSSIWDGLKAGIDGAAKVFTGIGTKIWEGVKAGFDTLSDFFKNLFKNLNPANLLSKVFGGDDKGPGKVEGILGINVPYVTFAEGGLVPGNALVGGDSALNDRILALLSPGEAIIPRSLMNNPAIASLVQSVLDGKINPQRHYYGEDRVNKTVHDVSHAGEGGGEVGSAVSSGFKTAAAAGKKGFEGLESLGQEGIDGLTTFLGALDPSQLWNRVMDYVKDGLMNMISAHKFHSGGLVAAGMAHYDLGGQVPALMQPGEFVMSRTATNSLGVGALNALNQGASLGSTVNNDIKVELKLDAKIDMSTDIDALVKNKLMPALKKELRLASSNGERLISPRGVR